MKIFLGSTRWIFIDERNFALTYNISTTPIWEAMQKNTHTTTAISVHASKQKGKHKT